MCAVLIGGMDRLKRDYMSAAKKHGVKLVCYNGAECSLEAKLGSPDMLIMFTNMISHEARKKVMSVSKSQNIPLQMRHSCGVSSLRSCFAGMK